MTTLVMPPEIRAELERMEATARDTNMVVERLLIIIAGVCDSLEQVRRDLPVTDPARLVVDRAFVGIEEDLSKVLMGRL